MNDKPSQPEEKKRAPSAIGQEIKDALEAREASQKAPTRPRQQGRAAERGQSTAIESQVEATISGAEILASSAQEFRDSLQTIRGALELLLTGKVPDARQAKQFLGIAYRETETLSSRVSDLQVASLIEVGRLRLKPTLLRMDQLLTAGVEQIAPAAADKSVTVEAKSLVDLPEIHGDEALLRIAIANTLQAAIKSASSKGSVTVSAAEREAWIVMRFSVNDEAELLNDAPASDVGGDMSLLANRGLAIYVAEKILQAHSGRFWVEGTSDKIASLNLALPLVSKPHGRGKILVVDDNPQAAILVEYALQEEGYEAIKALNGLEGLEIAKSEKVDLVILDVLLPGIDGFEVCHRLRSDPEMATIPVIMVSAKARDEDRATAMRIGADAYFAKPLGISELMEAIQNLLEGGKHHQWREAHGNAGQQ
ncbi:MAG: hypothetical protein BMS9Abin28_0810 [Anaerolineae bacterium]|nr:MAG: hypothetical protein BMS9Abin28_0810 [Anaerolineae bacterium]